jgi:hypothetical protein
MPPPPPPARARRALFLAIVPLWALGLDALWPVSHFRTGGCMTFDVNTAWFLEELGGLPLLAATLPVSLSGVVLAALVTAAALRRLAVRFRRPRGPIPGRRSRRVATVAVWATLASLPLFGWALLSSATYASEGVGAMDFRGYAVLSLGVMVIAGALLRGASSARGFHRWGLLMGAWTAVATPRTVLTWVSTFVVELRLERVEHVQGAGWRRLWGADVSLAALGVLGVLSVIAGWPPRRCDWAAAE